VTHRKYIALLAAGLAAWPVSTLAGGMNEAGVNMLCLSLAVLWAVLALVSLKKGKNNPALGTNLILAGGFVAAFVFVLKLPYLFSWHDLASYSADFSGAGKPDGHLGYIAYLVEYGRLPLEDPRIDGYSVFYNPPLYHMVQACFMKLNLLLGIEQETALENLQLVTMLCTCACAMAAVDLMRLMGAKERGVRVGAALMSFQPMMLLMGATLNNDILSVLLVLWCVLFTVRWHKTRRMRDIVLSGVTLGLGMAAKMSIAIIIPCIATVFAVDFFRDWKKWKRYAGQFAVFLLVSVPEAVAWPLFHLMAYQMPLNYVRLPAETINVSGYSLWQRFGIPGHDAIRGLFYSPTRRINHNVWMQTLKTGMFDELTLFAEGTFMWYAAYLVLVLFAGMLLAALVLFIRMLVQKRSPVDGVTRLFLASYGALLIGSYLNFCIQYPYICTFNFRYILPVLALCALAYALYAAEKRGWWARLAVYGYCGACLLVYGVYFFAAA